jgi:DNA primase
MDVIALAQQGLRNAVATLGTATSEEHLKRLFRIVPSVLFCFDGDAAGRKAAWRALEATLPNLQDGRRARFLFLPDGEDPDTLVRAEGTDAFRARIQQHSQPLADYFFQQLSDEADPRSLEGKAHLATLAAPLIEKIPGANLRALMRQRLTEITGLNGEALQHMAAAPTTAPNNNSVEYDDAAYYDTGSHYAETDYFQPPEAPKPQRGEKKEWKKDWKKSGQRPDFKPRGPRTPATVEPPTLTTLRTLLHHPELAQKVEDVSHFAAEDDTYAQLLVALLGTLQKNPKLRSLQLIARWHGTDQGRLLRALAEKEWLISADNLEQQFFDTINSLAARQRERRLESLLRKARQGELSAEEKDQLRNLLSRNAIPATPTSTGV